jgi:DNA-binding SARP family transcriptional activator
LIDPSGGVPRYDQPSGRRLECDLGASNWGRGLRYRLQLLGDFALRREQVRVALATTPQRLVAFLAINGPTARPVIMSTLWPRVGEKHARGRLRTAIWRVHRGAPYLLAPAGDMVGLGPGVSVDIRAITDSAQTVLRGSGQLPADRVMLSASGELLAGWYDDWVIIERERFRQLRLHALDALAGRLTAQGRYAYALEAAVESARIEPLRETANRLIIAIHLAEGNVGGALRHYRFFRSLLDAELGIEPSAQITAMLPTAALGAYLAGKIAVAAGSPSGLAALSRDADPAAFRVLNPAASAPPGH